MHNPEGSASPAAQNKSNPVPEFISINRESNNEHQNNLGGHPSKATGKGRGRGGGSVVYGAPKATPTGSTSGSGGPRSSLVTSSARGQTAGSDHVRNIKRKREAISGDRIVNEVTNSYEHFNGASTTEAVQTNGVESVQEMPWHPAGLHQYTKGIIG